MGLWSLLTGWRNSDVRSRHRRTQRGMKSQQRRCRFETMEERRLLAADAIRLGVVYIEEDSGSDLHPDTFEILFEGGAPGTELTRLVIDGDKTPGGLSLADMIFDTVKGGLGADQAAGLKIVSSTGIDHVSWQVADGSSQLIFEFRGFHAGEKLIFTIDVDEVQEFDPGETDLGRINEGIDPIASGVEFQGSKLHADFKAPHYHDINGTSQFRNVYDPLFVGSSLLISQGNVKGLPHDDHLGRHDRTAGTMLSLQQLPKPVTIGGRVFADNNRNLIQDGADFGIGGVALALWQNVGGTWTFTGHTTTTSAQGDYQFGANLNLQPGTYQVRQTQPAGYFSVGAIPGKVGGTTTGSTVAGNPDVLTDIALPLGDLHGVQYNFAEAQPASLRGRVHLTDADGNCFSEEALNRPLAGVKITLKDQQGNVVATTLTNASGEYVFSNLMPGTYTIVEQTPPGLIDGGDHIGTIGGIQVGVRSANDTISSIVLLGGQHGSGYDFCEHEPSLVSGYVYHDANNNGRRDAGEQAIPGVTITLLDASGTQVATAATDAAGFYKFTQLSAGTYTIRQVHPAGWLDGLDAAGTIGGVVVGTAANPGDQIGGVKLRWGESGIEYNFGELKPGSIQGRVWLDDDENWIFGPGETPLSGVTVQLLTSSGQVIRTTTTNAQGQYQFTDLAPGVYAVRELQPAGYLQGGQKAGSHGGDASVQDLLSQLVVSSGSALTDYDFRELLPVSIAGLVWSDVDGDCVYDAAEQPIAGVTIRLLDAQGNVVATTLTGADGRYEFTGLRPGTYGVRQVQPGGYFDGAEVVGSHGGTASANDQITGISLRSGQQAINYDFCEMPPGKISGFVFRDGPPITTNDGQPPANLYEIRDGKLTPDDVRLKGVVLELRHTATGELVRGEELLPGAYPPGPVRVVTDASGYYEFKGLPEGNYSVFQVQPAGYFDSLDTAGTLGGLAVNIGTAIDPQVAATFAARGVGFNHDAILKIPLGYGQQSQHNNFSEVEIQSLLILIPLPEPLPEPPPVVVIPPPVQPYFPLPQFFIPVQPRPTVIGGSSDFTWHLSIIDAGLPRIAQRSTRDGDLVFSPVLWVEKMAWKPENMRHGKWLVHGEAQPLAVFGLPGATPVVGDWNGDGKADIGVVVKGEWFLDLNGNGEWDPDDLWAQLGSEYDRPVTGDWNGDGKTDIGIFGPQWAGDGVQLQHEAGLPDQANQRRVQSKPKNLPPSPEQATDGERRMRLTAHGRERADLIDHVLRFGGKADIPIAGDFNGDGIRTVGTFRDGTWHLDMDGDGRWSAGDVKVVFGQKGDLPVVGDFNGDGVEEIAIFRNGKWIIDVNGNREIDGGDLVLEFGEEGDIPIAGDFNGDGVDQPAVYRQGEE